MDFEELKSGWCCDWNNGNFHQIPPELVDIKIKERFRVYYKPYSNRNNWIYLEGLYKPVFYSHSEDVEIYMEMLHSYKGFCDGI